MSMFDLVDNLTGHTKRRPAKRRAAKQRKRNGAQGLHKFTVQKAYCSPAKSIIMQLSKTYGVKVSNYKERVLKMGPLDLPYAQEATFTVKAKTRDDDVPNWMEYLMERTQRLEVVKGRVDGRNIDWAGKYNGEMPVPWIETDCHEGHKAWKGKR